MTVEELINYLRSMNHDLEVVVSLGGSRVPLKQCYAETREIKKDYAWEPLAKSEACILSTRDALGIPEPKPEEEKTDDSQD